MVSPALSGWARLTFCCGGFPWRCLVCTFSCPPFSFEFLLFNKDFAQGKNSKTPGSCRWEKSAPKSTRVLREPMCHTVAAHWPSVNALIMSAKIARHWLPACLRDSRFTFLLQTLVSVLQRAEHLIVNRVLTAVKVRVISGFIPRGFMTRRLSHSTAVTLM